MTASQMMVPNKFRPNTTESKKKKNLHEINVTLELWII